MTEKNVPASRKRPQKRKLRYLFVVLLSVFATLAIASPAQAATTTPFRVTGFVGEEVEGTLTWLRNAVDVTTHQHPGWLDNDDVCVSVVYNGYHRNGTRLARRTLPGDGNYSCVTQHYTFRLEANDGTGPIRTVEIVLWSCYQGRCGEARSGKEYRPAT